MNKILFVAFFTLLILGKTTLHAQDYTPPKDVKFEKSEDYAKYEPEIIKCIEYLNTTSLNEVDKRIEANRFFMMWLTGAPNVTVDILPYLMDLTKVNKDFLIIFMGGWTKYAIESKDYKNKVNGHLAGLRAIIRVYKQNKGVKSDDAIDDIASLEKNGKLEKWVQEKMEQK